MVAIKNYAFSLIFLGGALYYLVSFPYAIPLIIVVSLICAVWVIKGDNIKILNIEFRGAKVPDRNGDGIRHQGGRLSIENSVFHHNEMGLITWNNAQSEVVIRNSQFAYNILTESKASENYAIMNYGSELDTWSENQLVLSRNKIRSDNKNRPLFSAATKINATIEHNDLYNVEITVSKIRRFFTRLLDKVKEQIIQYPDQQ